MVLRNTDDVWNLVDERSEAMARLKAKDLARVVKEFMLLYSGIGSLCDMKRVLDNTNDQEKRSALETLKEGLEILMESELKVIDRFTLPEKGAE